MPTFFDHFCRKKEGRNPDPTTRPGMPGEPSQGQVFGMVELYRMIQGRAGGPEIDKLKVNFINQWDKLADDKREIIIQTLLEMQLLPEIVGKALKVFNGKIIRPV